ncbi:MAG: GNAT family N-acetyltransferase [Acidobacteriota bacterium]|nr:GNAT family N-acetyltransferase [Acidobacteriota bacterium]
MIAPAWSNPHLILRRAKVDDAGLLAELGAHTFSETFGADNNPTDMAAYLALSFSEAQQAAELADPHSTFHIAETNGVAVGYAMLRSGSWLDGVTDDKPIELVRLYVSREHLGRGVGAALMRVCMNEASHHGHRTLWLGVWEHNHRAQAFYRRWNFHEVGTHIFQLGDDAQTDILMERPISADDIE